ncbi:hypothetical protein VP1G_11305 [Cytospora mali]|uniref:Uncharacterized protein n=1 Tax=Cytospora mali TaxID=578113 RepID=A0A194VCJ3_CYTMA|nr:hypothetical protein VP1G_11305 [Valsa mali var. pyri (nom. inval.)]
MAGMPCLLLPPTGFLWIGDTGDTKLSRGANAAEPWVVDEMGDTGSSSALGGAGESSAYGGVGS